ncbi:MAG: hypothetical protein ACRD3N_10845, partial [Terracidiphilus sp.]
LVTFQVMRRTLGTDLQKHGTLKDAQGALRHASISTTGNVYVQVIEQSVLHAMNSRTLEILADWEHPVLAEVDRALRNGSGGGVTSGSQNLGQVVPSFGGIVSGVAQKLSQVVPSLQGRKTASV